MLCPMHNAYFYITGLTAFKNASTIPFFYSSKI